MYKSIKNTFVFKKEKKKKKRSFKTLDDPLPFKNVIASFFNTLFLTFTNLSTISHQMRFSPLMSFVCFDVSFITMSPTCSWSQKLATDF